jgi:hypothetical protein
MEHGEYKFCIRALDTTTWVESGVSVTTQNRVSSVSINGIVEVLASIPIRKGTCRPKVLQSWVARINCTCLPRC